MVHVQALGEVTQENKWILTECQEISRKVLWGNPQCSNLNTTCINFDFAISSGGGGLVDMLPVVCEKVNLLFREDNYFLSKLPCETNLSRTSFLLECV